MEIPFNTYKLLYSFYNLRMVLRILMKYPYNGINYEMCIY